MPTKNVWKPKHCGYKSVITEHQKTSHKLSKTIRRAKKEVVKALYSDTKKSKTFLNKKKKKEKETKRKQAFKVLQVLTMLKF